jgi:hypothetical protein
MSEVELLPRDGIEATDHPPNSAYASGDNPNPPIRRWSSARRANSSSADVPVKWSGVRFRSNLEATIYASRVSDEALDHKSSGAARSDSPVRLKTENHNDAIRP